MGYGGSLVAQDPNAEITRRTTPDGIEYGLWGERTTKPAPTLFVLASDIETTLGSSYFRQAGEDLAKLGFLLVSIDLPCHGARTGEGQPSGLGGWRTLAERGEDFVADNNARLSSVLDDLIDSGLTDPEKVAVCGTSRGGFLAIHFAAHDARVKAAAAFAPATDLSALSEFRGLEDHDFVNKLSLANQAERLAGRPVWIVIGDQDLRVGTDKAIELASRISAVARERKIDSRVELRVMPEPRGHTTPKGASGQAAEWIRQQLPGFP